MRLLHKDLSPLVSFGVSGLLHIVVLGTIVVASWLTRPPPVSHLMVVLVEGSSPSNLQAGGEDAGSPSAGEGVPEGQVDPPDSRRQVSVAGDSLFFRDGGPEESPPEEKGRGETSAEMPIREGGEGPLGQRGEVFAASLKGQGLLNEFGGGGSGGVNRVQGASPGAQGSSLLLIREKIVQVTLYPAQARQRRIEGTVEVRFTILKDGRVGRVEVLSSSGSPLLDRAAVETLYRAEPLPVAAGWIRIPIAFQLTR